MVKIDAPPHKPLDVCLMYPLKKRGRPDWRAIKDHIYKEGRIEKSLLINLITNTN